MTLHTAEMLTRWAILFYFIGLGILLWWELKR